MHFPLDRHELAQKAGEAVECAGAQNRFWDMHSLLFARQELLRPSDLVNHANALGLNADAFKTCLKGAKTGKVRSQVEQAKQLGVRSTPTFFFGQIQPDGRVRISGKIVGSQPITVFRGALQQLLGASVKNRDINELGEVL